MTSRCNSRGADTHSRHGTLKLQVCYANKSREEYPTCHHAEYHRDRTKAACGDGNGIREHAIWIVRADCGEEDGLGDQPMQQRAQHDQWDSDAIWQLQEISSPLQASRIAGPQCLLAQCIARRLSGQEHGCHEPIERNVQKAQHDLGCVSDERCSHEDCVGVVDVRQEPACDERVRAHGAKAQCPEV